MLSASRQSRVPGNAQSPKVQPNQGQEEKLQLQSHGSGYLLNLGNYLKKRKNKRGWKEARDMIIRARDSKFGLRCNKINPERAYPGFM